MLKASFCVLVLLIIGIRPLSAQVFDQHKLYALIPQVLEFRQKSLDTYQQLIAKVEANRPFDRSEIDELEEITIARKTIRVQLLKIMSANYKKIKSIKNRHIQKKAKAQDFKSAYLGALALFYLDDNYRMESSLYNRKYRFRKMLNRPNQTVELQFKDGLEKSRKTYYSFKSIYYRFKLLQFIKVKNNSKTNLTHNEEELMHLLYSSPSFVKRFRLNYSNRLASNLKLITYKIGGSLIKTSDFILGLKNKFVYGVSYAFGKTIAQIQWKKGKLLDDAEALLHIQETLEPGDILWDRTRFKVSGRIISIDSFWHHNAIYIGNKQQLQELGIWDHPLVKKHQHKIENGKTIVEALGAGVVMNSIKHFLNVDDLAIARKKQISKQDKIDYILRTLAQVDKLYDFNLEIDSGDTLICSELVDVVYKDLVFPRKKVLGVWSITPDQTAIQTLEDGLLELILFYYDGQRLSDNFSQKMREFLATKASNLEAPVSEKSDSEKASGEAPTEL